MHWIYSLCYNTMNELCTMHIKLYTFQKGTSTELCTIFYTMNKIPYVICTIHYSLCITDYVICTIHYLLCIIHYVLYTIHYILCTYYVLCTIHYPLFIVFKINERKLDLGTENTLHLEDRDTESGWWISVWKDVCRYWQPSSLDNH